MNKLFFIVVLGSVMLNAADFVSTHNSIQCGKKQMRFLPKGTTLLQGPKCFLSGSLNIGTKGGYFSFGSAGINGKFDNPEKGFWEYSGSFPEDRNNTKMELKQSFELTPLGSIEAVFKWKASNPNNLTDTFYIVYLPIAHFQGKSILFNGQEIPVSNITKYGFFSQKMVKNPELTFYHWDKDKKFIIQGEGNITIVFQSIKDKNVMVRFYPQPADGTMKLIWKIQ